MLDINFVSGRNLENNTEWNAQRIQHDILRLKYHLGNPNGIKVHDPVLLQDKFNYMAAIKQFVLPTLKVPLTNSDYKELKTLVQA